MFGFPYTSIWLTLDLSPPPQREVWQPVSAGSADQSKCILSEVCCRPGCFPLTTQSFKTVSWLLQNRDHL